MTQDPTSEEPVTEPLPDDIHAADASQDRDEKPEKPSFVEGAGTG